MKKLFTTLAAIATSIVMSTSVLAGSWCQIGNDWYYYQDNGTFATGSQTIDGSNYCFDPSGKMYHDIRIRKYIFDNNGRNDQNYIIPLEAGYYAPEPNQMVITILNGRAVQYSTDKLDQNEYTKYMHISDDKQTLYWNDTAIPYNANKHEYRDALTSVDVKSSTTFDMYIMVGDMMVSIPYIKIA